MKSAPGFGQRHQRIVDLIGGKHAAAEMGGFLFFSDLYSGVGVDGVDAGPLAVVESTQLCPMTGPACAVWCSTWGGR